jgi:hypothetical protein
MRKIIIMAFIFSLVLHGILYCVCSDAVLFDMGEYASKINGILQIKINESATPLLEAWQLDETINAPSDTELLKQSVEEFIDKENIDRSISENSRSLDSDGIVIEEIEMSAPEFDMSSIDSSSKFSIPSDQTLDSTNGDVFNDGSLSEFVDVPVRRASDAVFSERLAVEPKNLMKDERASAFLAVAPVNDLSSFSDEKGPDVKVEPAFKSALVFQGESPVTTIEIGEIAVAEGQSRVFGKLSELLDAKIETFRRQGDEAVYAKITVAPKSSGDLLAIPKDLLFLVDVSDSISKREVEAIRQDISSCLERLNPQDGFNIVLFNVKQQRLYDSFRTVNAETMQTAQVFLPKLGGSYQTNIYNALMNVVPFFQEGDRVLHIVFLSDARPTDGTRNFRKIINDFTQHRIGNIAFFTYDIGAARNRFLLDYLAYENRGKAFHKDKGFEAEHKLGRFMQPYATPLVFDLKIDDIKGDTRDIFPRLLNHVYREKTIEIFAKLAREGTFAFDVSGITADGQRLTLTCAFNTVGTATSADVEIMRQWAHYKLFELISLSFREGMSNDLERQIDDLKMTYNIKIARELSRYLK